MTYFFSILLIITSNVCYNITQKSTPGGVNPFAALLVTYLTAALITFVALIVTQTRAPGGIVSAFHGVNWISLLLGVAIVGLELGYLLAFRAGWNISKASLVANIALALILIPIGVGVYGESFSLQKSAGVALCLAGLFLLNR